MQLTEFLKPDHVIKSRYSEGTVILPEKINYFSDSSEPIENAWVRCGLCFAGCNKMVDTNSRSSREDGVLTGLEIINLDLAGTDIVVLSACDTGAVSVLCGQGVAGLRQAFLIAGAKSVLASLWWLDDQSTATRISSFYENLNKGLKPAEALAKTQRELIAKLRKEKGYAHPAAWAALGVTGENVAVSR